MTPGIAGKFGFSAAQASLRGSTCVFMMIHVLCMGCGHSTKSGNNQESSPAAARAGDRQSETSHSGAIPYVGSAACVECHSETADEYQSHPMSRSLASTLNAERVEDMLLPRFSTVPELAYLVEQDKDHTWHHEIRLDEAKNVINDTACEDGLCRGIGSPRSVISDQFRRTALPVTDHMVHRRKQLGVVAGVSREISSSI